MSPLPANARTAVLAAVLAVSAPSLLVPVLLAAAAQLPGSAAPKPLLQALLRDLDPVARAQPDPRAELVELQRQGRWKEALERVRALAEERPEQAAEWGLPLLAGDLHDRLGQPREALRAFAEAMATSADLAAYSRYRLAREYADTGHPEMAAGLVATVVAGRPEPPLAEPAVRLLRQTLEDGGECRLLRDLDPSRYADRSRRRLELTRAGCARREGDLPEARALYLRLLRERLTDEVALASAYGLEEISGSSVELDDGTVELLGRAFHQHRDFDRAIAYLGELVGGFDGPLAGERWELAYMVVRSRFWQERYAQAASGYAALAARSRDSALAARALYQQARCLELMGDWADAAATFRQAYRTDPDGDSADGSLVGAMRIEWRSGSETSALELFELLAARREWTAVTARAALFLAASDLVQGMSHRAGAWLDVASRAGDETDREVAYWRGRLAELKGDEDEAVRRYLRVMALDPYHPLGLDASRRVRRPELEPGARRLAQRRLAAGTLEGQYEAWLLLSGDPARRAEVAHDLARALARDPSTAPFLTLALVPTADWPLWREELKSPDEKLMALGLWIGGAEALPRHFPLSRPSLAFTRSWLLARAGALRESLEVAEILARRAPPRLPGPFLPPGLQRLLYPFAFPDLVVREAMARRIDPYLLSAIAREESRFDRDALSPASARGLTQFIQPTAEQVARRIGLAPLAPADLYRPEVAFALGAAYLEELLQEVGGIQHAAIAAYNAGLPASGLWQSYCYSGELAEFYSKVSYRETRGYVGKVTASWARYREIYGTPEPPERTAPEPGGVAVELPRHFD